MRRERIFIYERIVLFFFPPFIYGDPIELSPMWRSFFKVGNYGDLNLTILKRRKYIHTSRGIFIVETFLSAVIHTIASFQVLTFPSGTRYIKGRGGGEEAEERKRVTSPGKYRRVLLTRENSKSAWKSDM